MKHIIIAPEDGAPDALQAFVVPDTRAAIELAVEALIQRLDEKDGDPDLEDGEAGESAINDRGRYLSEEKIGFDLSGRPSSRAADADDSAEEVSWTEWHTRVRHKDREPAMLPGVFAYHEDSEDDDPRELTRCERIFQGRYVGDVIPDDAEDDDPAGGAVDDVGEMEQMGGDVPAPRAFAIEPDPATGERTFVGFTNLLPSFVDNGGGARDAFTGRVQYRSDIAGEVRFDRPWRAGDFAPPPPAQPKRRGEGIDPAGLPDLYALTCEGTCLEPVYRDGCTLAFSKTERPEPGDYVAVLFKPGVAPADEPQGWVKRLISTGPEGFTFFDVTPESALQPFVRVEMLNPPKRFIIPATKIAAIHKCLGPAVSTGDGRAMVPKHLLPAGAEG